MADITGTAGADTLSDPRSVRSNDGAGNQALDLGAGDSLTLSGVSTRQALDSHRFFRKTQPRKYHEHTLIFAT